MNQHLKGMGILRIRSIIPAVGFQRLLQLPVFYQFVSGGKAPRLQIKERQIADCLFI
ncbi:hypothetical protein D3C75_1049330 [compost metagenome]